LIRERPPLAAYALGYGILSLLRPILGQGASGAEAARLGFDHWCLDRKFWEACGGLGIPDLEARRVTALMKAALSRTVPENRRPYETGSPCRPGLLGTALIEENYQAEDFRAILGINFFEDVTWFNKEGFEDALLYGSLFFTLESGAALEEYAGGKKKTAKVRGGKKPASPEAPVPASVAKAPAPPLSWPERMDMIAELAEALTQAEAASGYRLDGLLDSLSGEADGKKRRKGR
jgi:hypothetical protein